ncbi:MAG TPA: endonuclease/exonuclease/phosphatase family protein [Gemmatimonadaceae bacterium]|nr:endonuclease/exonuclease/phosphatase family protein [Gemmatimonadaceae bacterium]
MNPCRATPSGAVRRPGRGLVHRLCLGLVILAAVSGPAAVAAQAPVRVLSFNIRYGTAPDGEHVWPNRRPLVIATVLDHAPHVLGVQEALRGQLDALDSALPAYRELGVGRDDGRTAGEYSALFVDTARFAILDHGTFWLSDTPDVPGSTSWGNRITRIVTWARLVDRAEGGADTLRVYNLHWDHESQPSRERSAQLLRQRMESDGSPGDRVIVMGDFNSDERNPAYLSLLADVNVSLHDAFRAAHPDAQSVGTYHAFKGDSTGGMIDHILVGAGWRVEASGIDRRKFGALWPSDHFPVWAVIGVEAR